MVGLALDAGVNLFDSAEGYGQGQSEEVLGAALRRANARDRVVIATKVSTFATDASDPDLGRLSYRHVVGNAEAAGGFLTGKYTRADPTGGGGRRAAFSVPPIDLERGYDAVDKLGEIAASRGVPIAHVAYAWLLGKPDVGSAIVGGGT
jgi:aryl-alcohol dehydrogenase-like predicted oxidoreductase